MIKIENVVTPNPEQWESIIVGMRHPLLSYEKSDTTFYDYDNGECRDICGNSDPSNMPEHIKMIMGTNDIDLMERLCKAGSEHCKFMRMITVYLDITAPLYWWKEFDTYKIGTVANSTSTMHKIHAKEFTLEDFSCEHLLPIAHNNLRSTITALNQYRYFYSRYDDIRAGKVTISHEAKEIFDNLDKKDIWWQMIQLLPSSYNQKRKIMLNYEVLTAMHHQRKNHKLDEWRNFCSWIETLPYSELITGTK